MSTPSFEDMLRSMRITDPDTCQSYVEKCLIRCNEPGQARRKFSREWHERERATGTHALRCAQGVPPNGVNS